MAIYPMRSVHLLAGLSILLAGTSGILRGAKPDWVPVTSAELAEDKPQIEPEAAAEILNDQLEINDTAEKRYITWRVRYKIYDPARAVDEVTRIARFWGGPPNPYYQIEARLTLPDGTSRFFGEHDMRRRRIAEWGRSSGLAGFLTSHDDSAIEEKFLVVTGVVKGAVLDVWEYEPGIDQTNWMLTSVQRADVPIRHFEYVSHYKPSVDWQRRGFVLNPCGGRMTHDDKAGETRFVADRIPSIHREPLAPPESYFSLSIIETYEGLDAYVGHRHLAVPLPKPVDFSLGPWAFFSTAQDFYDADIGYVTRRIREKARELTEGTADPREKARRIYAFVQDRFQHFRHDDDDEYQGERFTRDLEEVGDLIDRVPNDAEWVTPRELHYLFVALLRGAELECHTTLHPRRTAFRFNPDMVSALFLPYLAVAVKTGATWVLCDPCTPIPLPFGIIPWNAEGQPALMAMPRQQAFLNVPPAPAEASVAEVQLAATLAADGSIEGRGTRTFTGHYAELIRHRLLRQPEEEWPAIIRSVLDLDNSPAEIRMLGAEGLDRAEDPVTVSFTVRWPAAAAQFDGRLMLPPALWHVGQPPLLNASKRTNPVAFPFPQVQREVIRLKLPDGFRLNRVPKPLRAATDAFGYELSTTYDEAANQLTLERSSTIRLIEIPVSSYPPARNWFRQVSVADQTSLLLTPSDTKAN